MRVTNAQREVLAKMNAENLHQNKWGRWHFAPSQEAVRPATGESLVRGGFIEPWHIGKSFTTYRFTAAGRVALGQS
jgi:hypothetical protein